MGSIFATGLAIIGVLVGIVYGGIKDDIKKAEDRIEALSKDYRDAYNAAVRVQDLIAKAPNLEAAINDTRVTVAKIDANVEQLKRQIDPVPQQLQSLQRSLDQLQNQVGNIQSQIQRLPGMPR